MEQSISKNTKKKKEKYLIEYNHSILYNEGGIKVKKKKGGCLKTILIVFGVFVVIGAIGSLAGGDKSEPKKVSSSSGKNDESSQSGTVDEKKEFQVGETVSLKDVNVTLISSTESAGSEYVKPDDGKEFLILEFNIENNSSKDINISSVANFEAYCDDYSLNQDILGQQAPEAEGKTQLDGSVASGKKMNGIIVYQVPTDFKSFEINVAPDFWSTKDIKYVINK